ncbi:MAG: hypothetical protein AAF597_15495 [Bacteroidota bacterium]
MSRQRTSALPLTMLPRNLFLLDATGALLSALLLGVVLPLLHEAIGIPLNTLYWLAALALVFAVYSFTCYYRAPENWRPYLRFIACVNLLYCCLTAGLVFLHEENTVFGVLYFVGEIIVVVILALFELRFAVDAKTVKGE